MKFNLFKSFSFYRQSWLAVTTLVALIMLIIIQISWIVKAARLEEHIFNHRVEMALKEVRNELGKKASDCNHMKNYLCGNECPVKERETKIAEVDSIIRSKLIDYQIELDYDFFINNTASGDSALKQTKGICYLQNLNGIIEKDGIRIGMQFPGRNQFLIAQMKGWFIVSLLFIVFIAISFVITLRLFLKERAQMIKTTDFINNMVHEFQTPLANMKLAANLIRKKMNSATDPKIDEYTQIILRENLKMEGNVREILKIASIDQTAAPEANINLHEVIQNSASQFKYLVEERHGQIELTLNASQSIVYGCEEHFNLLFSNLIDNALKYTTLQPHIKIETYNQNKRLYIHVTDNGIGINDEDIPFIFDKYFRVSTGNLHNVKGFGLGLTYVKKITDIYHGTVQVKSQPGKGTTFELCFPVKK